ncbi:chromosomal replication initiator protein DnaA [Mycoplasma haemofelis str. Langford 1]|uniref:Chromosomal replication initiator protein DnaA n=1 Tax=Mycoplasma haemofelis (strain Langford 1) TaxID=941640 RepID=E8ZGH9_MYCHL|nr:helix-turn-helix domain-containing protein [Mycoplasma haemofelis]CBY92009.1 chromosomal replication initiator protein DnaA [Mycoplasma haemofelis str. Langford 1]
MENKDIWSYILKELKRSNSLFNITPSLSSGRIEILENEIVIFLDEVNINLLKSEYFSDLKQAILSVTKKNLLVNFEIESDEYFLSKKHEHFLNLNKNENFFVCEYNSSTINKLEEFLRSDSDVFYLWGNKGTGKSHLIAFFINQFKSEFNILYLDVFDFVNKYYEFERTNKSSDLFINNLLSFDLVIFDNFQFVKNKSKINSLLLKIVDDFSKEDKKLIFVSSFKRNIFDGIDYKLISKFDEIQHLKEPEIKDVKLIISKFVNNYNSNIRFTSETIDYLSEVLGNNIQIVVDKLKKILQFIGRVDSPKILNFKELKENIENLNLLEKKKSIEYFSNDYHINFICKKLNFKTEEILENTRKKETVSKRDIVIYLLKTKFNLTHQEIGKIFNKKHSTISHSLKKMNNKLLERNFKKYLESLN